MINNKIKLWKSKNSKKTLDFNPSYTNHNNENHLFFRRESNPPVMGSGEIYYNELTQNLLINNKSHFVCNGEDPRCISDENFIYLFYVKPIITDDGKPFGGSMMLRIMKKSEGSLQHLKEIRLPNNPIGIDPTHGENTKYEKNWVPYIIKNSTILIIYSCHPWAGFILDLSDFDIPKIHSPFINEGLSWEFGEIRGGTNPVEFKKDELITFYHSSVIVNGKKTYYTGACIFSKQFPFSPIKFTKFPVLISPHSRDIKENNWSWSATVIFPMACIINEDTFRVCLGVMDGDMGYIEFKIDDLLKEKFFLVKGSEKKLKSFNNEWDLDKWKCILPSSYKPESVRDIVCSILPLLGTATIHIGINDSYAALSSFLTGQFKKEFLLLNKEDEYVADINLKINSNSAKIFSINNILDIINPKKDEDIKLISINYDEQILNLFKIEEIIQRNLIFLIYRDENNEFSFNAEKIKLMPFDIHSNGKLKLLIHKDFSNLISDQIPRLSY